MTPQPTLRTNRNNDGRGFENLIQATLTQYEGKGIMRVKKCSPPARIIGGPRRTIIHLDNPWLDWAGTWTERGGRMILFESKSTGEPRLKFGSGGISDKQRINIRKWHTSGAVVFLLWEHEQAVKWIWGMAAVALHEAGAKSILWDNANCLPVPAGLGFVRVDFVKVIERWFGL